MSSFKPLRGGDMIDMAGPVVIGNIMNFFLFGLLSVQIVLYYVAFTRDRTVTKLLVGGVYGLLLLQVALNGRDGFLRYTGQDNNLQLGWFYVAVTSGIVGMVVQMFYAWRITILAGNQIAAWSIAPLALISAAASFVAGAFGSQVGPFVTDLNDQDSPNSDAMRRASVVYYVTSAVCDVYIAIYMVYLLMRNGKIIHKHTRSVVQRLIHLIIETNMVTALAAVISVFTLVVFQGKTYFTTPTLLLPSIYGNTFLLMLNSRFRIILSSQEEAVLPTKSWRSRGVV